MSETRSSMVGAQCECADCRQYRLWRAEGTDEWQPDRDNWNASSMTTDRYAVDAAATSEPETIQQPSVY